MSCRDQNELGGGGGIRTLETVARLHAFQACAFSHSATPPALTCTRSGALYLYVLRAQQSATAYVTLLKARQPYDP